MIDKLVTLYRKAEMGVISGLSGASADAINENNFYDVGYIQSQISCQTAHCGRHKPHFDFGDFASSIAQSCR